ncbi:MAG: phospho-sugar mutase [Clostridia bacterium]|nr:phospho-sugar mutase [Clostridia bacterium]
MYNTEYKRWLASGELTDTEREELLSIENNEELKEERFGAPMDFGTAGLRSTMYVGLGCMNRFTVRQATRGIADLIIRDGGEVRGVAIAYDSRNNSREFAKIAAETLAGRGIKCYIFTDIRPTPELSFAVLELSCIAGINITASHNPKEYNGYKAYWQDGAQISPEQAQVVKDAIAGYDPLDNGGVMPYDEAVKQGLVIELSEEFDERYLAAVLATAKNKALIPEVADSLKVVYTPLHGAGYRLVPEAFRRAGLKHLYTVDAQMTPDGNFPTVKKPNPEYADVFAIGIDIANEVGSDLVIATDPDSDRVGVMARDKSGEFKTITGNQMGALLLDYVIIAEREAGRLKSDSYAVKSLVSTDMANKICRDNGVVLHEVLTGFKFIGEVMNNYEAKGKRDGFLLGFEESYGYLLGTYARDKDAVEASLIILEMTAYYKKRNMTLIDALSALYERYGYFAERTIDIYMEGARGIENRRAVMASLRNEPPKTISGAEVSQIGDYMTGLVINTKSSLSLPTGQKKSDVLYYTLNTGDKIIIRPSGTEPKIKIYVLASDKDAESLEKKVNEYIKDAKRMTEV